MSENQNNGSFQYTYSAREQEEVKRIRSKYLPKDESKLERLRRLDEGAAGKATGWALAVGVIGTLILGTGMSLCMVWGGEWLFAGIALGMAGMAALGAAYPLYNRILKRERERIAPEVLQLADELMK